MSKLMIKCSCWYQKEKCVKCNDDREREFYTEMRTKEKAMQEFDNGDVVLVDIGINHFDWVTSEYYSYDNKSKMHIVWVDSEISAISDENIKPASTICEVTGNEEKSASEITLHEAVNELVAVSLDNRKLREYIELLDSDLEARCAKLKEKDEQIKELEKIEERCRIFLESYSRKTSENESTIENLEADLKHYEILKESCKEKDAEIERLKDCDKAISSLRISF